MEEQKNSNNPPANQPVAAATQNNISTTAGALIILVVAVIVGAGVFYLFQTDFSGNYYNNNSIAPGKSLKSTTETTDTKESETASQAPVAETAVQPATGTETTFNFDYELKKLDDQNNSINPDDFNENEMSDANIGI